MKTISKILSIVLALSMVLALCLTASAATTEVKICDFENADPEVKILTSKSGRNSGLVSVTADGGYKGSKGLKFEISALGGDGVAVGRTHTANIDARPGKPTDLVDLGFNMTSAPAATTDILWFWLDANVSTKCRVQINFNEKQIINPEYYDDTYSIYTLKAKDDGTNEIVEIPFGTDVDVHGVTTVPYTDNTNENANFFVKPGFEGWVGFPVFWIGDGHAFDAVHGENANETLLLWQVLLLIQNSDPDNYGSVIADQKVGDHIVLDELCFTPAGQYPAAAGSAAPSTPDEPSKTADAAALVPAMLIAAISAAGLIVVLKKKEF